MHPLTETQYRELEIYEDGDPLWQNDQERSTSWRRLRTAGYIAVPPGFTRADGLYEITAAGRRALAAFREEHGIEVAS